MPGGKLPDRASEKPSLLLLSQIWYMSRDESVGSMQVRKMSEHLLATLGGN